MLAALTGAQKATGGEVVLTGFRPKEGPFEGRIEVEDVLVDENIFLASRSE